MSTARHIVALLRSHIDGDEDRFLSVATQLAAHEARQGHGKLAQELRELIDAAKGKTAHVGRRGAGPVPLKHVPIICTRNPHGGSNWRLGGRSVVERMGRWRGRGDEWFVRQAFAEMPSVC